jgi:hypothetical protein
MQEERGKTRGTRFAMLTGIKGIISQRQPSQQQKAELRKLQVTSQRQGPRRTGNHSATLSLQDKMQVASTNDEQPHQTVLGISRTAVSTE